MSNYQKFGWVTSGLPAVVNDQSLELIMRSFYEGPTSSMFKKQTGIKSTEDLHYLTTQLYYQTESGCSFDPSGNTYFSKRTITVGKIKIQNTFCERDLEGFWTERALRPGANYDYITFEADWTKYLTGLMTETMETALWQSNLSTGTGNYQFYDGFLAIIDAAVASTVDGNPTGITTGVGITASNVIGIFDGMWAVLPITIQDKPDIEYMVGNDTFNTLILALKNANLFHYDGVAGGPYKTGLLTLPGTGQTVRRLPGLNGTNRIILARTSNFVIGTDGENDYEMFNIRQNPIDLNMMVDIHFKVGTQVELPTEIVSFKLV